MLASAAGPAIRHPMLGRRRLLAAPLGLLTVVAGCAGGDTPPSAPATVTRIPPGDGAQTPLLQGDRITLYTHRPATWDGKRVILLFHGLDGRPLHEVNLLQASAARNGAMLVAPHFERIHFPEWRYQFVGVQSGRRADHAHWGSTQPRSTWTGNFVVELMDALRRAEGADLEFRLVGHSAGGQFVNRFAAFHDAGAVRLVAANPASMLFPSRDLYFPYGFGRLPEEIGGDAAIRAYLRQHLVIYVGERDSQAQGSPDINPEAMKQGHARPVRAKRAFDLGKSVAATRGWEFNWRFIERPGVGHGVGAMLGDEYADTVMFGALPPSA